MSRPFTTPNLEVIRHLVNEICGQAEWQIQSVGAGVTSLAWEAVANNEKLIVRAMPVDSHKPMTYPPEMAVLHHLYANGWAVPEPIVHSRSHPLAEISFDWAITRKIKGQTIGYDYFPPRVAKQFGKLLAACHAIPIKSGWGWLQVDNADFYATQLTPQAGTCERWSEYVMYPLDDSTLDNHAVQQFYPEYIPQLEALAPRLIEMAGVGQPVICHSDLHAQHIFVENEALAGVIDFGDACILPAAWDLAIIAFYYGWETLRLILNSYTAVPSERAALLRQTYSIGIIFDLNKLEKALHRYPQRLANRPSVPFFAECLSLLAP